MNKEFMDIYKLLKDDLFRLAYSYTKNIADAEDVLQDVFIQIHNNFEKINNKDFLKPWCVRVTINKCKDLQKSMWKKKMLRFDEKYQDKIPYPTKSNESELLEELLKLPTKYRVALFLHYYEGYKTNEIATILNKNESTIRSYLKRGRDKLKTNLKEGFIDEK